MAALSVEPKEVIQFDRTDDQLLSYLFFLVLAAGKNADEAAAKHWKLIYSLDAWSAQRGLDGLSLEEKVVICSTELGHADLVEWLLRPIKTGKYNTLASAMCWVGKNKIDLRGWGPEELEQIPGVGPKTSRLFLLTTRRGQRYAALDTHVLKYLRDVLGLEVPKQTPTGKKYMELEQAYLAHCDEIGRDPAELDLEIWKKYSGRG